MTTRNPVQEAAGSLAALATSADGEGRAEVVERGLIPTSEAARLLHASEATVLRKARELGGRRGPRGKWLFELERIRLVREDGQGALTRSSHTPPGREQWEGERDARCFAAFEANRTVAEIVVQERVPARVVLELRETWLQGHLADRQGVAFTCGCGSPANPTTARCLRCHERTRTLSDAQMALLAGADLPPPGTCECRGCAARVPAENADSLCVRCGERLTVVAGLGGVLAITLAGRVVRELTVPETRTILGRLAHHVPQKETS